MLFFGSIWILGGILGSGAFIYLWRDIHNVSLFSPLSAMLFTSTMICGPIGYVIATVTVLGCLIELFFERVQMTWTATTKETWESDFGKIVRSKPNEFYACLTKRLRAEHGLKLVNYGPFYSLGEAKAQTTKLAQPYLAQKGNKTFA